MKQYIDYLKHILDNGVYKEDRTGTGALEVFGYQMRFNLSSAFPLVTTKYIHMKSVIHELLWFISGSTNTKYLNDNGVRIWNEWADEDGELGPVYGKQWRNSGDVDQLEQVIRAIKTNPNSRRIIMSAWNVGELEDMALPPCHVLSQYIVTNGKLSCQLYQRSADSFLGVPFNIASYSLLTHLIANECGLEVGEFIWSGGSCHVYSNHVEQVREQIEREPYPLPSIRITPGVRVVEAVYDDIEVCDYVHHPHIKGEIAV